VGKILSEGLTPVQHPYREPTHAIATTRRARPGLWIFAVSLVSLVALAYPLLATAPRLETRFGDTGLTLDGLAYLDSDPVIFRRDEGDEGPEVTVALAQDLPLIKWIRDTVAGSPTIVEWTGDLYDWNSRIAIHTGLPTVLGWDWHQRQQRGDYSYLVDRRRADVQDFYRVADPAAIARFLKTYEVSFVVIGTQEHRHGNEDALAAIDTHPVLVEVFRSGDKAIYQVDREALWGVPF